MFMPRGQYWFVVSALLVAVFGFPLVVGLTPGPSLMCADQVQTFDSAGATWRWVPPGVECHVTLLSGEEARSVRPRQQPNLDG